MRWAELWGGIACMAFMIGVLGNIVSSLLWGIPAFVHIHRHISRGHERLDRIERAIGLGDD